MDKSSLNIPLLTQIAEWLEAGAPESANRGMTFSMEKWLMPEEDLRPTAENWCGTTCCIAGAAVAFGDPSLIEAKFAHFASDADGDALYAGIEARAAQLLGLPWRDATDLFHARHSGKWLEDITAADAAAAIRTLIKTGEVRWT